ncbi:2-hydroxyacid dehydrogenase [Zavarzinia sp. CC-PAN008]|uniref:2-hydroxyacid dehydrogenase n=1 Tax=Zavarzinia sp. CC-PAN008 TaxID=3243332 RepID=UPI003F746D8B
MTPQRSDASGALSRSRPGILATRALPQPVTDRLVRDYNARLNATDGLLDPEALVEHAAGAEGLIVALTDRIDAALIARLPDSVRVIATYSVGFEHIDLNAAAGRGLVVTNTPDVLTDATADLTLLLILGAARRAAEGQAMIREDRWGPWSTTGPVLGVDLRGRRLGIAGMGRIGRAVAARARAFGLAIHYWNRSRLPPALEEGAIHHATLEDLLAVSDVLALTCASTAETRGMLNAGALARLPRGAIVVNSARGDLVRDDDLVAAVDSGQVGAIGLDVYAGEPRIHPAYRRLQRAFLLPHMGSATWETRVAMGMRCLDNLDAFFAHGAAPDDLIRGLRA